LTRTTTDSFGGPESISLIAQGRERTFEADGEAIVSSEGCPDIEERALTLYLRCPLEEAEAVPTVHEGDSFDGKEAVLIRTQGGYTGIDSTVTFTYRLYVDGETYLPLAFKVDIANDYAMGDTIRSSYTTRYRHEFVPRDSLPNGFFRATEAPSFITPAPTYPSPPSRR
jgi:hypothetical protein